MPSTRAPSPDLGLPETIGRYQVRGLIGEGSMGRVLLAHDPVLDRDVAVKHLRHDLKIPRDVRDGLVTRMQHEARAAARVAHPNLVVLHDMGEDAEIGLYLVFEYVEGPTLKQRIAEGRMPTAELVRLANDLCAGLGVAHDAGILHRDVKPENVILAKTGAKIADFGIARIPDSTLTHQGGLMGTPAYSAPETFRAGKFSPESDQFSLAATLYEALSGQRAFPGEDAVAVAARIAHESPEPFAASLGLPTAVDAVFARALSRKAEERFPSCTALGAALADAVTPSVAIVVEATATSAIPGRATRTSLERAAMGVDAPPAGADGDELRRRAAATAPERKTGQIVLGGLVVVVTAALLVRAAIRSAERPPPDDPLPLPVPTHSASATTPKPRLPPVRPVLPRSPPSAAPATSTEPGPDAGAAAAPPASASAAAGSAAPSTSAPTPPIGSAKNGAPPP
ncbi:MAG: protein kinase [Byssovorax sp.]